MAELGDISGFLKEGSPNNLDWLDVDEKAYRELDTLPKQNLDVVPDLEAAWSHQDKDPATYLVPNKALPRTMGDLSEAHGKLASQEVVQQIAKVARLVLMQSTDKRRFVSALTSRFTSESLRAAKEVLVSTLAERGLLGKYYLDSNDFQDCHKASRSTVEFVRRYAQDSRFVVAKPKCTGCVHSSGNTCAVFQKKLVLDVPYSAALAEAVEHGQVAQGKVVQASNADPKERIRAALMASDVAVSDRSASQKTIVNPAQFTKAPKPVERVHLPVLASEAQRVAEEHLAWNPVTGDGKTAAVAKTGMDKKAFEVVAFLRRELLKGRWEQDLLQSLKFAFTLDDLRNTRSAWEPLFKQAGHYGTIYSTQESFDDCHEGADFIAKHNPSIKGVVAGGKCPGCIYNKLGRCMMYGRPLVAKAEDLYTSENVGQVIWEHRQAGRLETGADKISWGATPAEALKTIYRTASQSVKTPSIPMRAYVVQEFRGKDRGNITGSIENPVAKVAACYLNEGLYGKQLFAALHTRFSASDVFAATESLKKVLAEQGLQGIYYIDPTAYSDYAKGCEEGSQASSSPFGPLCEDGVQVRVLCASS